MLIYGELAGFGSRPLPGGRYRQAFDLTFHLRDATGQTVLTRVPVQGNRQPRDVAMLEERTFFYIRELVPHAVAAGQYEIEIEARDLVSEQTARGRLPVEIQPAGGGT